MTANFRMPPEWHPQDWLWVGFPHLAEEWSGVIGRAQEQIAAFANAVADSGQQVRLVVRDAAEQGAALRRRFGSCGRVSHGLLSAVGMPSSR